MNILVEIHDDMFQLEFLISCFVFDSVGVSKILGSEPVLLDLQKLVLQSV